MAHKSAIVYILKALIPYSRENLNLAFKPNRFFDELERTSGQKRKTLQTAYYRAHNEGLIQNQNVLTLTGWEKVLPFVAKTLQKDVVLMVIFDIPEDSAPLRRELRGFLRRLDFIQEQQSVWVSSFDYTRYVEEYVKNKSLQNYVQVYEAARIC